MYIQPRPKNKKSERVDRRLKANANPNKRAVLVMREHYSEQETSSNAISRCENHRFPFSLRIPKQ